jgi:NRPS condensation-like uncharacterized protein
MSTAFIIQGGEIRSFRFLFQSLFHAPLFAKLGISTYGKRGRLSADHIGHQCQRGLRQDVKD